MAGCYEASATFILDLIGWFGLFGLIAPPELSHPAIFLKQRFAPASVKIVFALLMTNPQPRRLIIAIDGPAGAGKSTIASRLARKLGYINLESGAMYRALALMALECNVSFDDEAALVKLAEKSRIRLESGPGENRVFLDHRDISYRVREADVTEAASRVSVHPQVRQWMVARQRDMGLGGGVVMEGRDIGTKVFPDADVKIFLDADPVEREKRRREQQRMKGIVTEDLAAQLRERDQRDRTRPVSPLIPAPDAILIDSTNMSEEEVFQRVEELVRERLRRVGGSEIAGNGRQTP